MIRFPCPTCGKSLNAPDERAGSAAMCPGCRRTVAVPPVTSDASSPVPILLEDVMEPVPLQFDGPPPARHGYAPTADDRSLAMMCHLGGVFFGFWVPLIIWLVKKEESRFISDQAKECLNFHLSMLLYILVSLPLVIVIALVTCGIGALILVVFPIFATIMGIIAACAANGGEYYRYPLTIRFIQ